MPSNPRRSPVLVLASVLGGIALLAGCGQDGGTDGGSAPSRTQAPPSRGGEPQLSTEVCDKLEPLVRDRIAATGSAKRQTVRVRSSGTSALSTCSFLAPAATITVSLDTAAESNQRFSNRLVEEVQFSNQEPDQLPRKVPGVGDPGEDYGGAAWTTARAQLLAIRGNRLLIIGFYVRGAPDQLLKDSAAALARRTYEITRPIGPT